MLKLLNISSSYKNGFNILNDFCLNFENATIGAVLGLNGAGKSTLLKTIMNMEINITNGRKFFEDVDFTGATTEDIVKKRIVLCPEGRQIFKSLNVQENLNIGTKIDVKTNIVFNHEMIFSFFPILKERLKQAGGSLSGGEQQMLALARSLLMQPKLLLLDEPSLGLSPIYIETVFSILKNIVKHGTKIILAEQNIEKAISICDYVWFISQGSIKWLGNKSDLINKKISFRDLMS